MLGCVVPELCVLFLFHVRHQTKMLNSIDSGPALFFSFFFFFSIRTKHMFQSRAILDQTCYLDIWPGAIANGAEPEKHGIWCETSRGQSKKSGGVQVF